MQVAHPRHRAGACTLNAVGLLLPVSRAWRCEGRPPLPHHFVCVETSDCLSVRCIYGFSALRPRRRYVARRPICTPIRGMYRDRYISPPGALYNGRDVCPFFVGCVGPLSGKQGAGRPSGSAAAAVAA